MLSPKCNACSCHRLSLSFHLYRLFLTVDRLILIRPLKKKISRRFYLVRHSKKCRAVSIWFASAATHILMPTNYCMLCRLEKKCRSTGQDIVRLSWKLKFYDSIPEIPPVRRIADDDGALNQRPMLCHWERINNKIHKVMYE